jgi:hypothetical protein
MVSDPSDLQHPLDIESVDWSAGAGGELVVRVAGRWRQHGTAGMVPPVLAIDAEGRSYRFPAVPEERSAAAAQPGHWQASFAVPASLATGRTALLLGSVSIPLPAAAPDPGEPGAPAGEKNRGVIRAVADPAVLADRRQRQAELAEREARRRAAEAEAATGEARVLLARLELELGQARGESERLRTELERAERKGLEAEQLAHSERAMRLDLGRDHALEIRRHQADARAVLELLEAAQIHAHDLGREVETLRREATEETGEPPASGGSERRVGALAVELAIAASTPPAPVVAMTPAPSEPSGLSLERAMVAIYGRDARWVERESGRSTSSPGAAAATGVAESGLDEDRLDAADAMEAIEAIARQLAAVRAVVTKLPPPAAEGLGHSRVSVSEPTVTRAEPAAGPPTVLASDRLAAALDRLREESPAPESPEPPEPPEPPGSPGAATAEPAGPPPPAAAPALSPAALPAPAAPVPGRPPRRTKTSRWLLRALRSMLRDDPAAVGKLVVRLVPAQCLVVAGPVSYDIALSGRGCVAVTVRDEVVRLDMLSNPRSLDEVDFRVEGDLEALGRLLVYGSWRRRFSRRVARVRGNRRAFAAWDWLVREPLGLQELCGAGLRLDSELTFLLVAYMIDRSWTAGERFTVGHEAPGGSGRLYLLIRDGERPRVSRRPPLGPVATTIRCTDDELLSVLAGGPEGEIQVRGAREPIALLCEWIARAQRDS